MNDPVDRVIRAIARRNSFALMVAQFGAAHLVLLGGVTLLRLFQPMSAMQFWWLVAASQGLGVVDNFVSIKLTHRMWRPVRAWERGRRDDASTVAAWQVLATFPLDYFRRTHKYPLLLGYAPFIAFATWRLALPWYSGLILAAVGTSVMACGLIVRYFAMEIVTRPLLERVARELPEDFQIPRGGLPLRWRLLVAAPVINAATALVVAGLAARGHARSVETLGIDWLLAVAVSLTLSLELILLVVRNLGTSLREIQGAVERVQRGDLSVRVPVVAADEIGRLTQSFNRMVEGLSEREALRSAFGAYVDPGLAERVVREGVDLAGEEIEVTVLFLDICRFTSFAEHARPRDVVARLNEFWELVVPVLLRWQGHANKFIGDGLLAVFGAPERVEDHALRAVSAALEVAEAVAARYRGEIRVGIGVNTGRVVAGTVGGGGRVEFTVIGDTVNTASRVEAITRETDDTILITEATRRQLPPEQFEYDGREPVALRGKSVPVQLWAPQRAHRVQAATAAGVAPAAPVAPAASAAPAAPAAPAAEAATAAPLVAGEALD